MDGSSHPESKQRRVKSGPHIEKRLNAAFVKKAGPGRHSDGGGLYLKVDPSGARRWILRIVVRGRRRDFGLGSANLVSLADARETAFELRKIARAGGNPRIKSRESEGKAITFKELAYAVHQRKFKDNKNNGKHVKQWIRTLETYVFPVFGDLAINEIHQDDIEEALDPIWTSKPETARRVLQRTNTIFDFACGRGYRSTGNPATGLRTTMRKQEKQTRHFAALEFTEMPDLMNILTKTRGVGALALRFAILTGSRTGPIRKATWDQISEDFGTWTIPAEIMKSRKEFVIPLSMPAQDVLRLAREDGSRASKLVFQSRQNPKRMISNATMRKLLQTHYPGLTVHGMRASFRTWAREVVSARDDVAEMALAHSIGTKTTQAYNRAELLHERETLLEKWGMWAMGELEWFSDDANIEQEIWRRQTGQT